MRACFPDFKYFVEAVALLLVVAGCATSPPVKKIDRLSVLRTDNPRILVMTPDIKYFLLTAGGVAEPHGEWTESARRNFAVELAAHAHRKGVEIVQPDEGVEGSETEAAYQKLYSAVGATILVHHFGPQPLPTKEGSFDWSLGPGVQAIGGKYGAHYALFSFYRDYQASGGRIAFAVLAAIAGVGVVTGSEGGYASLIDLKTGDVVWFNRVLAGSGELRDENGARLAVDKLFEDLPGL